MSELLDPDMPAQQIRLHMGELTSSELLVARAAIRWANTRIPDTSAVELVRSLRESLTECNAYDNASMRIKASALAKADRWLEGQ